MTIRARYEVFCDTCGDWIGEEGYHTSKEAATAAKLLGWLPDKHRDWTCSVCQMRSGEMEKTTADVVSIDTNATVTVRLASGRIVGVPDKRFQHSGVPVQHATHHAAYTVFVSRKNPKHILFGRIGK